MDSTSGRRAPASSCQVRAQAEPAAPADQPPQWLVSRFVLEFLAGLRGAAPRSRADIDAWITRELDGG